MFYRTPAEAAGVKFPYGNWQDIVAKRRLITAKSISSLSSANIPTIMDYPTYTKSGFKIATKKSKKRITKPTIVGLSGIR
jgi:hypothetical protein